MRQPRTIQALFQGERKNCFRPGRAQGQQPLVSPLDPRLIPGRESLHGDNMFSLHSESYLRFVFVPDFFFLGWPFVEGYNIQTEKWPSRKLESFSASWIFIQGCSQILFLNVHFSRACTSHIWSVLALDIDSSSSRSLLLFVSASLALCA